MLSNKCAIWPDFDATCTPINGSDSYCIESKRAGGKYEISPEVAGLIEKLKDPEKIRLTTWLVDQQLQDVPMPKITKGIIEQIKTSRPLSVSERADRLLRFVAQKTDVIGGSVSFLVDDIEDDVNRQLVKNHEPIPTQNTYLAYAWSGSTNWQELDHYFDDMTSRGWLKSKAYGEGWIRYGNQVSVTITIDGYSRIEGMETQIDSAQAFVAMWFSDEMEEVYNKGIKPAIEEAGYKPMRIDQKPDLDKIDDEIVEEICRSLFMIADMTHGNDGARGSVYYEAGFAYGLGKPVIYTCRKDMIKKIHFDIRQYAHILWEEEKIGEFRKQLYARILARIGEAPEIGATNLSENDSA